MDNPVKLEILLPAQAELEEIARVHMALSGPQSARSVTNEILSAMEQLQQFPLSGPPLRDAQLSAGGYRSILAHKYLLYTDCGRYDRDLPYRPRCHRLSQTAQYNVLHKKTPQTTEL